MILRDDDDDDDDDDAAAAAYGKKPNFRGNHHKTTNKPGTKVAGRSC